MATDNVDMEFTARIKLLQDKAGLKAAMERYSKSVKAGVATSLNEVAVAQMAVRKAQFELDSALGKGRIQFAGYAMSIMFFGMALQQMSMRIMRFGTKAFTDVMHSVEGTVTQSDYLSASMMYLGFTIGQAFEPVIAWIIPIIDRLAEWVSNNEETARTLGVIGIVAGTVFAVGGAAVLAINGFIELMQRLGIATLDAQGKITNMKGVLSSIGGSIAIGYALTQAKDAFDDFSSGNIYSGMIEGLSAGLAGYGGIRIIKGQKGGGALLAVGIALDLVEQGKFFQTLGIIAAPLVAFVNTIIDMFQAMFDQGIGNGLKLALKSAIQSIMNSEMMMLILNLATGGKAGKIADSILDSVIPTSMNFDFNKTFENRLGESRQLYRDWDKAITDFIATADSSYKNSVAEADRTRVDQIYINRLEIARSEGMSNADFINQVMGEASRSGQLPYR